MNDAFDIDALTIEELEALNHRVVERMKFLDNVEAHTAMMQFHPGARVCFDSSKYGHQIGTLMKFNQKTVTVMTDAGRRWNVPPQMLSPVVKKTTRPMHVIDMKKKKFEPEV